MTTDIVEKLLPCPFCGENQTLRKLHTVALNGGCGEILVTCMSCEGSVWLDVWNSRAAITSAPSVPDEVLNISKWISDSFDAGFQIPAHIVSDARTILNSSNDMGRHA